jgi:hypothetical protein
VLRENPRLGVSARIVEQYARADGAFYPAAIQHVLATHDPRIPQLGSWEQVNLSNDDGEPVVTIDLSSSHFPGEQPPPLSDAELTDAELEQLAAELTDEDLADLTDADIADLLGAEPDDGDELSDAEIADLIDAMSDGELAQLEDEAGAEGGFTDAAEEFESAFSNSYASAQARQAARADADLYDFTNPASSTEDVISRALARVGQGIYTDETALAGQHLAISLANSAGLCGAADEYTGRCAARYHDPGCSDGYESGMEDGLDFAGSGEYGQALVDLAAGMDGPGGPAFIRTEDPYGGQAEIPARTLELATSLNSSWGLNAPDIGDLTGPPLGSMDAYGAMAGELGYPELADPQPERYDGYPDMSELRRELGI